ncbi:MAG: BON domain-containing protein [Gallionella sp.]|nr:BON domain-containing protein [Gallionella sp.]
MKTLDNLKIIGIAALLTAGLSACDQSSPGPAETAGKKIDQTAEEAGQKMDDAVEKAGDKMEEAGEKIEEQGEKAGVAMDDTAITSKVKASIFAEPGLKTLQISVDTVKGIVTLSGSVDSQTNSDRARELAAAVAGVDRVENQLVVKTAQ